MAITVVKKGGSRLKAAPIQEAPKVVTPVDEPPQKNPKFFNPYKTCATCGQQSTAPCTEPAHFRFCWVWKTQINKDPKP